MNATTYFRAQAYHNAWSNHRLLGACRSLPAHDWVQTERVDRTLLHLFQHQTHHRWSGTTRAAVAHHISLFSQYF